MAELYSGEGGGETLRLDLDRPLPDVEVDPGQFRQVLHNLIRNAGEALANRERDDEERGPEPISIGTRRITERGREYVETRVDDNGPGIRAEVMGQIFQPYVSTKSKGTGLGLAIVKKIVDEHGGSVTAENRPEGGASLILRLPAVVRDAAPQAPAPAPAAASGGRRG